MTTTWNAHIEVRSRDLPNDRIDELMDATADYAGVISQSPRGWVSIRLTVPGESLAQATRTATLVAESATGSLALAAEVVESREFDAREGFVTVPDLIGATEAAERLGLSRMRVNQLIAENKLESILVGKSHAITLSSVRAMELQTVGFQIGPSSGIDFDAIREDVLDPAYEKLRGPGLFPTYEASEARKAGEKFDEKLADAWDETVAEMREQLKRHGYDADELEIMPFRTRREYGSK